MNDYWTEAMDNCPDESGGLTKIIDLWQTNLDEFGFQGPASQYNSTCSPLTPMDQVNQGTT